MTSVSVLLVSYNQAAFAADCAASLRDQRFRDFEIIHVDNGSTDDSGGLLEQLLPQCGVPFQQVRNPENLGITAAFRLAFERANGAYVVPLAADDRILPDRFERQVRALDSADRRFGAITGDAMLIDVAGCRKLDASGRPIVLRTPHLHEEPRQLQSVIEGHVPLAPTAMWRSSTLREIGGFDLEIEIEDYDLWLRLLSAGYRVAYDPTVVTEYRVHDANVSRNLQLMRSSSLSSLDRLGHVALTKNERRALVRRRRRLEIAVVIGDALAVSPTNGRAARSRLADALRGRHRAPVIVRVAAGLAWVWPSMMRRVLR